MAKSRADKAESLKVLVDGLKKSKSVVFANFQGLKVKESEELRNLCRAQGIEYFVAKKTLVQKALGDAGMQVDAKSFPGGVSTVFGINDEVAPAQILAEFAKKHESVKFFGGILEGKFIAASEVDALAKLPSKQQLLAQLVGTLNAPVSGFVNVLAGNLRGLVNVLNSVKDQKAKV
ncbi:MAG TPA: 50S ribosomal protein L10 [Candidatus Magasanikbacteria bacterium]|nr:50S ribosomal protein L10 [Candidatus Magasanikbacteria bacterium]